MQTSTTIIKLDIEALLNAMPEHLVHYAGAAHRDPVAWHFCRTWQAMPTADEATLKSRALKAAWGWDVSPEQIRAANPGMR